MYPEFTPLLVVIGRRRKRRGKKDAAFWLLFTLSLTATATGCGEQSSGETTATATPTAAEIQQAPTASSTPAPVATATATATPIATSMPSPTSALIATATATCTPTPTATAVPPPDRELPSLLQVNDAANLTFNRLGVTPARANFALGVYKEAENFLRRPPTYREILASVIHHEIGILRTLPQLTSGGHTFYDLALEGIARQFFWNCPGGTCSRGGIIGYLSDYGFWINAYTNGLPDISKTGLDNPLKLAEYYGEVDRIFANPGWQSNHAGQPWTHGNHLTRRPKSEYTYGGEAVHFLEHTGQWFWIFDQGNNNYCNSLAGQGECFIEE